MSASNIKKAGKAVKDFDPDIIYCPGPASLPWGAICGRRYKKPVVWHLHHIFLSGAVKKLLNFYGKYKSVKKIIAVSDCVGSQIKGLQTETLYNPVSSSYKHGSAGKVKAELTRDCGIRFGDKSLIIGHIGSIQVMKRQDTVIAALKLLREQGIEATAIFAGAVREDGYMELLRQRIASEGLNKYAVFLGMRDDIADLLQVIDILTVPSREGLSLAALEACAAGVPFVSADYGGSLEIANISGAGIVFEYGNAASLAEAIKKAFAERDTLSVKAKAFAEGQTEEKYGKRIRELFESVL